MIPLTLAFRGLKSPLSQEMTAGRGTLTFATPASTGMDTVTVSPNSAPITLDAFAQPRRSARPGPVDPAPVSAADLPQYTAVPPSDSMDSLRTVCSAFESSSDHESSQTRTMLSTPIALASLRIFSVPAAPTVSAVTVPPVASLWRRAVSIANPSYGLISILTVGRSTRPPCTAIFAFVSGTCLTNTMIVDISIESPSKVRFMKIGFQPL